MGELGGKGVAVKGPLRDPCADGTVRVWTGSVPTAWLWPLTSFQRCHHGGEIGKGHVGSLCIFPYSCVYDSV